MKVKKAWLISEGGMLIERRRDLEGKELSLQAMYPLIGNGCDIVERIPLKRGVEMWVDEEGLLKPNTFNPTASELYRKAFPHVPPQDIGVVGAAIVIDNSKAGDFISA